MKIQNPFTHHPFLTGVKFIVLFLIIPIWLGEFTQPTFWLGYIPVLVVFYPFEILTTFAYITGTAEIVDSTRDYDEIVFVPVFPNAVAPYNISNPNTPPYF